MEISRFCVRDIPEFLALADVEGWISGAWELEFLLTTFPSGCLVARKGGVPVAFVTSVKYGASGWIGNLIVKKELRGHGIGTALLKDSLVALERGGARTVWLTASESGRPIYERMGFSRTDMVIRWEGRGSLFSSPSNFDLEELIKEDADAWGDARETLIRLAAARGATQQLQDGFLVCQDWGDAVQLGPWVCGGAASAAVLLDSILHNSSEGGRVFLDVPEGNQAAPTLLEARGFTPASSTVLMYRGESPAYVAERIFALASMGSMG